MQVPGLALGQQPDRVQQHMHAAGDSHTCIAAEAAYLLRVHGKPGLARNVALLCAREAWPMPAQRQLALGQHPNCID